MQVVPKLFILTQTLPTMTRLIALKHHKPPFIFCYKNVLEKILCVATRVSYLKTALYMFIRKQIRFIISKLQHSNFEQGFKETRTRNWKFVFHKAKHISSICSHIVRELFQITWTSDKSVELHAFYWESNDNLQSPLGNTEHSSITEYKNSAKLNIWKPNLSASSELRKTTVSFVMYVCPSAW
jgi:hypothetical protein